MGRELPILFNTDMVLSILNNLKGTTRRIVKGFIPNDAIWGYTVFTPKGYISCRGTFSDGYGEKFFKVPYQPGDILYVRETWCDDRQFTHDDTPGHFFYKADSRNERFKWRPSIHMPKDAARIWLKVKDVRVERLQEIDEDGAVKEGICVANCKDCNAPFGCDLCPDEGYNEIDEFAELWNSTIKKSDLNRYGWDVNPYVWVIEFERCEESEH